RAPDNALRLERAQAPGLAAVVEHDPADQDRYHDCGSGIGRHDEGGVGAERHRHAAFWLACMICSERTRRRRISLRIAAICSVRNSSVKAIAITKSGIRKARSSVGPPMRITDAG